MMKKISKWFGWIGLALALIGVAVFSINSMWNAAAIVPLALGALLVVTYLVLNFKDLQSGLNSRSTKFGANAAAMVIFIFGILIVINILAARFSARLDSTSAKMFSLAEQTKKVLKNLDSDVQVIGFFKTGEEGQLKERLIEYAHFSPRLKYEFVDPDKKPGITKKYNVTSYNTVVITSQGKEEKINTTTEEDITNAIISVTRDGVKKIYFTTAHGERDYDDTGEKGFSTARELIEDENYLVDKLMLASAGTDIPEDCAVLIVAHPKTDLFPTEVAKIDSFASRGGKVLFLLDTDSPASYTNLVKKWGFDVGNDIVVDASGIGQLFGAGPTIPIVNNYADHAITEQLNGVMTFYPETRSVFKADDADADITFTEIAKTSAQSWAEGGSLASGEISFDANQDKQGPVSVFAVAEKTADNAIAQEDKYGLSGDVKTRIAVAGDADFASNSYIKVQGNSDMFLNAVSWLAQEEDLISVRPKDPEDRRLNITQKQSKMMLWLGLVLLPLSVFVLGIVVYRKRK